MYGNEWVCDKNNKCSLAHCECALHCWLLTDDDASSVSNLSCYDARLHANSFRAGNIKRWVANLMNQTKLTLTNKTNQINRSQIRIQRGQVVRDGAHKELIPFNKWPCFQLKLFILFYLGVGKIMISFKCWVFTQCREMQRGQKVTQDEALLASDHLLTRINPLKPQISHTLPSIIIVNFCQW